MSIYIKSVAWAVFIYGSGFQPCYGEDPKVCVEVWCMDQGKVELLCLREVLEPVFILPTTSKAFF